MRPQRAAPGNRMMGMGLAVMGSAAMGFAAAGVASLSAGIIGVLLVGAPIPVAASPAVPLAAIAAARGAPAEGVVLGRAWPHGTWREWSKVAPGLVESREVVSHPLCRRGEQALPRSSLRRGIRAEGEIALSYLDPDAIPYHVRISDEGERVWVGQGLNYARPQLFIPGDTLPEWEFAVSIGIWEAEVSVATPSDGSMLAALAQDRAQLLVFDPSSSLPAFPVLTFDLGPGERGTALGVSRDGSTLVVGANAPGDAVRLYVFDALVSPPETLWTVTVPVAQWDYIAGVDLTDDGSRILISTYYDWYMVDRDSRTLLQQTANFGQTVAGVSGDGSRLVTGGFDGEVVAWEWDPGSAAYERLWTHWVGEDTWVTAVAISRDGSTILAGTYDYGNPFFCQTLLFAAEQSTPLWSFSEYGGQISEVALSGDGSRAVAGSWGDVENLLWDLTIFSRETAQPLSALSSPGSFYSVDISEDGGVVVAGAKLVHAGILGRGGTVYKIVLDSGAEPGKGPPPEHHRAIETAVFPNPCRGAAEIAWRVAPAARADASVGEESRGASIHIYNVLGEAVRRLHPPMEPGADGRGSVRWDGRDTAGKTVGAGLYFYAVEAGSGRGTGRMTLVR
jgi:WD40 repeat protein